MDDSHPFSPLKIHSPGNWKKQNGPCHPDLSIAYIGANPQNWIHPKIMVSPQQAQYSIVSGFLAKWGIPVYQSQSDIDELEMGIVTWGTIGIDQSGL